MSRLSLSLLALAAVLVTACGGGGGGGGDDSSGAVNTGVAVSYSGSDSQAQVTNSNAVHLSSAVYTSSATSNPASNAGGAAKPAARALGVVERVRGGVTARAYAETHQASEFCQDDPSASGSVYGEAGEAGGVTLYFHDFHCYDVTIKGVITVAESNDGVIYTSSYTFDRFTVEYAGYYTAFSGTESYVYDSGTEEFTMTSSYVFRDVDGVTYKVDGFSVTLDMTGSVLAIAGNFYYPNEGYVSVSTPQEFTYGSCGEYPDGGILRTEGANSAYVELTFLAAPCGYTVVGVDDNGDAISLAGSW